MLGQTCRHSYAFVVRGTIYFICNFHVATHVLLHELKFIYSEKATKFCEISTVNLTVTTYIGQIYGGDFTKNCGLLRIYELYLNLNSLTDSSWNYHVQIEKPSRLDKTMSRHFQKPSVPISRDFYLIVGKFSSPSNLTTYLSTQDYHADKKLLY